jgi:peptide chain release factor 3
MLQFDVVAHRLENEYNVECVFDEIKVVTARWVYSDDLKKLSEFKDKLSGNLSLDSADHLAYLAPTNVNLMMTMERWPQLQFKETREH